MIYYKNFDKVPTLKIKKFFFFSIGETFMVIVMKKTAIWNGSKGFCTLTHPNTTYLRSTMYYVQILNDKLRVLLDAKMTDYMTADVGPILHM